jgi:hypothetical protein
VYDSRLRRSGDSRCVFSSPSGLMTFREPRLERKGRWGVLKHIPDITVDGMDDEFGEVTQLGENGTFLGHHLQNLEGIYKFVG